MERGLVHQGKAWYELGHRRPTPDNPNGGRYYSIGCRRCKSKHTFSPNSQSDDNLRKVMIRAGWELAREGWNHHLCPDCQEQIKAKRKAEAEHAAQVKTEPQGVIDPATMPTPVLVELWRDASDQDRKDFIDWFRPTAPTLFGFKYIQPAAPAPPTPPPPPDLYELYNQVSHEERIAFVKVFLKAANKKLVDITEPPDPASFVETMPKLTLGEHWIVATKAEKDGLLRYLEQANVYTKTLLERWDVATGQERQELINKRVPKPPPSHAPAARGEIPHTAPGFDLLRCSFCGKPSGEVTTLINGPNNANICNACIGICAGTVARAAAGMAPPAPPQPSHIMGKSEFARSINVQPCTISGYLNKGMPQRHDGKLDRDAALAWIAENVNKTNGRPANQRVDPTLTDTIFPDFNDDAAAAEMARKMFGAPEADAT